MRQTIAGPTPRFSHSALLLLQAGTTVILSSHILTELEARTDLAAIMRQEWFANGIMLGYRYDDSPIVWPGGTPVPPDETSTYTQTARPGARAPHVWLAPGVALFDRLGPRLVYTAGLCCLDLDQGGMDDQSMLMDLCFLMLAVPAVILVLTGPLSHGFDVNILRPAFAAVPLAVPKPPPRRIRLA